MITRDRLLRVGARLAVAFGLAACSSESPPRVQGTVPASSQKSSSRSASALSPKATPLTAAQKQTLRAATSDLVEKPTGRSTEVTTGAFLFEGAVTFKMSHRVATGEVSRLKWSNGHIEIVVAPGQTFSLNADLSNSQMSTVTVTGLASPASPKGTA